ERSEPGGHRSTRLMAFQTSDVKSLLASEPIGPAAYDIRGGLQGSTGKTVPSSQGSGRPSRFTAGCSADPRQVPQHENHRVFACHPVGPGSHSSALTLSLGTGREGAPMADEDQSHPSRGGGAMTPADGATNPGTHRLLPRAPAISWWMLLLTTVAILMTSVDHQ